jgi:hypothetical protein
MRVSTKRQWSDAMADKPGAKAPPAAPKQPGNSDDAGHLGVDDRGNVTWEWKQDEDLLADDSLGAAERLSALVDPSLDVIDEVDTDDSPISVNPKRLKTGYNPYNSGALGKQSWKKKKDLHELSKWIELRRKMAQKRQEEGE